MLDTNAKEVGCIANDSDIKMFCNVGFKTICEDLVANGQQVIDINWDNEGSFGISLLSMTHEGMWIVDDLGETYFNEY